MAAQTADRDTPYREGKTMDHPVAAATTIFGGALTCTNAAHNALPASDTANLKFSGVARKRADNSAGVAGAINVVVYRQGVVKIATAATFAVGDIAYVVDDQTVTTAAVATNDVAVGKVVKVEAGFVWIDLQVQS